MLPEVVALVALSFPLAQDPPLDVNAQLADRVAGLLELQSPAEHHDHGHNVSAEDKVFCEAQVLGTVPAQPKDAAEVTTVYANFFCAAGSPGLAYLMSSRASAPVAVKLDTNPPTVRIPSAGTGYEGRVRALIPAQYQEKALKGFTDPTVASEVKRRYEDAFPPA